MPPTDVFYFLAEDGDSEQTPNVMSVRGQQRELRLGEVRKQFALPGTYHFRFKKALRTGQVVWLDMMDDDVVVPMFEGIYFAKVTRLTLGEGSHHQQQPQQHAKQSELIDWDETGSNETAGAQSISRPLPSSSPPAVAINNNATAVNTQQRSTQQDDTLFDWTTTTSAASGGGSSNAGDDLLNFLGSSNGGGGGNGGRDTTRKLSMDDLTWGSVDPFAAQPATQPPPPATVSSNANGGTAPKRTNSAAVGGIPTGLGAEAAKMFQL